MLQILVDEIVQQVFRSSKLAAEDSTKLNVLQAIREPNFRYNGARLCNSISGALSGPSFPDFRAILFTRFGSYETLSIAVQLKMLCYNQV